MIYIYICLGIEKFLYTTIHDVMADTKLFEPAVRALWTKLLHNWNADILTFADTMPSKFRIQHQRLVTAGKPRNNYFSVNMRDMFIMALCYFRATLPEPSYVEAEFAKLNDLTDTDRVHMLQYRTLYEAILLVGEGHLLIIGLNPTHPEILKAQGLFDQAFLKVQSIGQAMSYNWHTLMHYCKWLLSRGNMRNSWLFFFERLNKMAKATLTNGRNGSLQVLKNFCKKHIAIQVKNSISIELPSLARDCQSLFANVTNAETGKVITKAQQRDINNLVDTIINRIVKRGDKHRCPTAQEALKLAHAQSDHPDLFSRDVTIDNYSKKSLDNWPVKLSIEIGNALPFLDGGALHRGLFEYLQALYPPFHINIRSVTRLKICEVNGVTCQSSAASNRSYTSLVYALRPNVGGPDVGGTPQLHVAKIRYILSVSVTLWANDSIARVSSSKTSPCTCNSPWLATEEYHKCPLDNGKLTDLGNRVSFLSGVMNIVVVDWLVPYHEQAGLLVDQLKLKHSSGLFMTSDTPHHEFDVSDNSSKGLEGNRLGNHFLDARRIIHGVVLKKVDIVEVSYQTYNPAYNLVVQLPKFI